MADYTVSKSGPGAAYPDNSVQATWQRLEPVVTPEQVRNRHLFGIPLISGIKDPISGRAQVYTDSLMLDTIDRSLAQVESETDLVIFPIRVQETQPFDRAEYQAFGYFRLQQRPASAVHRLSIVPPDGQYLYDVPMNWVSTGFLPSGQINLVPIGNAIAYGAPAEVGLFLNVFGQQPWTPAFWLIEYTAGFPDGMLPKSVNELLGVVAAMEVLSSLAATYAKSTGHSLGIDGLSQSVSTPGPQLYTTRLTDLAAKRKVLTKKLKAEYGQTLFSGNL